MSYALPYGFRLFLLTAVTCVLLGLVSCGDGQRQANQSYTQDTVPTGNIDDNGPDLADTSALTDSFPALLPADS